ncbi:MAG TPA: chromosomal replication initiator protein DnaA [Sedimentisphaerales bacterium]|nr:chromosomal replication initiator protein DnaA [Sedimentisphaerales bacterium]
MVKEFVLAARETEGVFADILERAKALDPVNSRKWFEKLTVLHFSGGLLEIGCPDEATVQYLRQKCKSSFTRAAQQVTGHLVGVEFETDGGKSGRSRTSPPTDQPELRLHPDYTFENFVVGPSNRLVHASCVAVSQSPGSTYNPLFIYGNSGLGKTHLLHAVCSEAKNHFPNAVIQFLSCEDFVNRFIRSIEEGNLAWFHNQFRTVDMLVIDDIQFLHKREQSQEEFFHTFNALYDNGKQIILSADSAPGEIPSLEERLISRFNWGLVARIDPPSYETRVAIVQKKAHLRDLDISEEVAEYIARKVHANIRELEGALTAIYAFSVSSGRQITLALAQNAIKGRNESSARHISMTDIIEVVTDHFGVRLGYLQSKKRSQSITLPRQICMYLARNMTRHSLEEIGGHLGGRDHTTVMHACAKIDRERRSDPQMNATLQQLSAKITESLQ